MKKSVNYERAFRLLLTGALLYYVWRGDAWAIKLSITLIALGVECMSFIISRGLE
jgi:hypothetical protein